MGKTVGVYTGYSRIHQPKTRKTRIILKQRTSGKYPDFFPGSVKHSLSPETHVFFCAIACVQRTLEMIPESEPLFDDVINQIGASGCEKLSNMLRNKDKGLRYKADKVLGLYFRSSIEGKWYARLLLLPLALLSVPNGLFNRDCWRLRTKIQRFVMETYNRDLKRPRVKWSPWLYMAILMFAEFCHKKTGPYEYDRQHRPLSADIALIRPKTIEGRAAKSKYDKAMEKFEKHMDKYYLNGARKWLLARVICRSVAEAQNRLGLDPGQLYKELNKEPWDEAMGYQKAR